MHTSLCHAACSVQRVLKMTTSAKYEGCVPNISPVVTIYHWNLETLASICVALYGPELRFRLVTCRGLLL